MTTRLWNSGSSPHVRGAPVHAFAKKFHGGIIPACAGSTSRIRAMGRQSRDHPRMCGEHPFSASMLEGVPGSSPHVRGALVCKLQNLLVLGIIPACAGSTLRLVRGGRRGRGSSPHVRGAPSPPEQLRAGDGIIPACAGSTWRGCRSGPSRGDHPRMCGEHGKNGRLACYDKGSSPHVRGALYPRVRPVHPRGIIPACAGSTTSRNARPPRIRDHPRMCGEHKRPVFASEVEMGSSPHVRGARDAAQTGQHLGGIIPACAGSTCTGPIRPPSTRDHPRMCGEH